MKTQDQSTSNKDLINNLYQKFCVPPVVIRHMNKVAEVCEIIANLLIEKGIAINKPLLVTAAKLHDTLRVADFRDFTPTKIDPKATEKQVTTWIDIRKLYGKIGHAKAMEEHLTKIGHPKLANLVKKHDFTEINNLETWEEKIIYYSDKRVDFDKIVSLKQRIEKGRKRNFDKNKHDLKKTTEIEKKYFLLEQEILKVVIKLPF